MEDKELKPCPFCGGKADIREYYNNQFNNLEFVVMCEECEANIPTCSEKEAVEAWNKRI